MRRQRSSHPGTKVPRHRFFRPHLEVLEDRLPPGDLVGAAAWGMSGSLALFTEDPMAKDRPAVVSSDETPSSTGKGRVGDYGKDHASILSTLALSFPQDSSREMRGPALAENSAFAPFEGTREGSDANDLFAAVLTARTGNNHVSTSPIASSANSSDITVPSPQNPQPTFGTIQAAEPSLPSDQAALEALAGQDHATSSPINLPGTTGPGANQGSIPNSLVPSHRRDVAENYGQLPMSFEANQGQTDPQVRFLSRGVGYTLFLTDTGDAVLSLRQPTSLEDESPTSPGAVVQMQVVGGQTPAAVRGLEEQSGQANYFIGNDPSRWNTNVATYGRVEYQDVYPGIDLVYYGNQRQLEYDFVVAPGADASTIALNFSGAEHVSLNSEGQLVLDTALGQIVQQRPYLYQEVNGTRLEVSGGYVLQGDHQVGFVVGPHDAELPLVIDPVLSYSSYLGGSGDDYAYGVAVDSGGNAYVTGETSSINFPVTTRVGNLDGVNNLAGPNTELTDTVFTGNLIGFEITMTSGPASGVARRILNHVGQTITVADYPVAPVVGNTYQLPFQRTAVLGTLDMVVDSPDPNTELTDTLFATNLAGRSITMTSGPASGQTRTILQHVSTTIVVADFTALPTPGNTYEILPTTDTSDVFVTKINATGTARVYSTYIGGDVGTVTRERGSAIAVDGSGNAYIAGRVGAINYPITTGAAQQVHAGGDFDAFVTKLNPTGSALVYSTYLGGSEFNDAAFGIAVEANGNAHVVGGARSGNFPVTASAFDDTNNISVDAFYTKLNAGGTAFLYSTYLGDTNPDRANAIALDAMGRAYIAGSSYSFMLPTTAGVFQPAYGQNIDGFVAKFDSTLSGTPSLVYLTYLGGNDTDFANDIDVDASGNAYVVGETASLNFRLQNPLQATHGGGFNDVFVTKINPTATALIYSTFLGGSGDDRGNGLALDSSGNVTITGFSSSTDYPTRRAVRPTNAGGYDAIVTRINAEGSALIYSTYLGGTLEENQVEQGDMPSAIALDTSGNAYVVGRTSSTDFPTTAGVVQPATGGGLSDAFVSKIVDDATAPLSVSGFGATTNGFILDFNRPIDTSVVSLFDNQAGTLGPADVTLVGAATGAVIGSLFLDASGTRITFIRTGMVMAGDTYTLTLRSAVNGFKDTSGGLLDGNRDGTPGDNFVGTFTLAASGTIIVSIPDFSRGPRQPVNVPATATRLPLRISNGAGITRIELTLLYNPALLTITAATVGAGTPVGANVALNTAVPGRAILTFTSPTAMLAGAIDFVTLTATVPTAATYGASHILDITNLVVNSGGFIARDDDGVHAVAYFGDTTGNGAYTSSDSVQAQRVAVGRGTGFIAYPRISPIIIADINANGRVDSTDALRILQEGTGSDRPEIPPIV